MKRLLIANRGEIARRIMRTAHAMGIETVAVYAEPDAGALHVREATFAFALGGSSSKDSYLRIDRLLEAARASGADALHPGYGFLSEDAGLAQAVIDAGLIWVGPPPDAIRALGHKSAAKALAARHGVPCLPGYGGADQSDERFLAEAQQLGLPLMIKAAAGGGGRGMRLVREFAELKSALASARSEAQSSFGNGELLIERALLRPRHVEVQVFADTQGNCIHLGERDCSVQRRHQKIIEESPSPAVDAALRERLGSCAVALARAAGYVGAGTVEFLLEEGLAGPHASLPPEGAADTLGRPGFYLMEMNTRLQVEHPVTEALTGLDLVEWQLRVARGEPLPLAQHQVQLRGHAIEVRLCAEDEHFTPHSGRVLHFAAPESTAFAVAPARPQGSLRFDHAIETGLEVTPHFDAMLGKLIAHADTRAAAIERLVQALGQTELLGLPSNRAFLIECLNHPGFRAGQASITFLDGEAAALRDLLLKKEHEVAGLYGVAAVYGESLGAHALACPYPRPVRLRHRGEVMALNVREADAGRLLLTATSGANDNAQSLQLSRLSDGGLQCTRDGTAQRLRAVRVGARRWHLQAGATDCWFDDASFDPPALAEPGRQASELRAPFNGRVLSVPVQAGQTVAAGDTVVVIESMKLEHSLASQSAARVAEVLVSAGQQVAPGQVLLRYAVAAASV